MPTVLTATPETSVNGVPRVRLSVSGAAASITVSRTDTSGSTTPLRTAAPATTSGGAWTGYDYEAPFDAAISYTVTDGVSTFTTHVLIQPSEGVPWLVHPGLPETSIPLLVASWPSLARAIQRGSFTVIGRKYPVVVSTVRQAPTGDLIVYTQGPAEYADLEAILADGYPLLLKGTSRDGFGARWVSVGDVAEEPDDTLLDVQGFNTWTLPLTITDAPVGPGLPAATFLDVALNFPTFADLTAADMTFAELASGSWKD